MNKTIRNLALAGAVLGGAGLAGCNYDVPGPGAVATVASTRAQAPSLAIQDAQAIDRDTGDPAKLGNLVRDGQKALGDRYPDVAAIAFRVAAIEGNNSESQLDGLKQWAIGYASAGIPAVLGLFLMHRRKKSEFD